MKADATLRINPNIERVRWLQPFKHIFWYSCEQGNLHIRSGMAYGKVWYVDTLFYYGSVTFISRMLGKLASCLSGGRAIELCLPKFLDHKYCYAQCVLQALIHACSTPRFIYLEYHILDI
jgi:hypothetical protein